MMRLFTILIVLLMLTSAPVRADWINLIGAETAPNIAEIYVFDDHLKLVLEVSIGDLSTFDELVPDEWQKNRKVDRPGPAERIERFGSETFQFVIDKGDKLPAELLLFEPRLRRDRQSPFAGMVNPYTRQRVPEPPSDKRVLYAELVYPFAAKPRHPTIIPPLNAEGRVRATGCRGRRPEVHSSTARRPPVPARPGVAGGKASRSDSATYHRQT